MPDGHRRGAMQPLDTLVGPGAACIGGRVQTTTGSLTAPGEACRIFECGGPASGS